METTESHPLKRLVETWLEKIRLAKKDKRKKFMDDADEAMRFFDNSGDWMQLNNKRSATRGDSPAAPENVVAPSFEMRVNKVAEMRDLFGPALYHTNPVINVEAHDQLMIPPQAMGIDPDALPQLQQQVQMNPLLMQDPNTQQQLMHLQQQMQQYQQLAKQQQTDKTINETRAEMIRRTLNYMQWETDKKSHARKAIDEALIMGAGCLWHEIDESKEGTKLVGSYYDSIKRLQLDPDARVFSDVKWICRECVHPYWQVEDEYNLPRGSLKDKCSSESVEQEADNNNDPDANDKKTRGKTNDLLRYYKLYSKMGMGSRLSKMAQGSGPISDDLAQQLEEFGDNCYLVIANGVSYPLNLPADLIDWQPPTTAPIDPATGQEQNTDFQFPQEVVTQDATDPQTGQPMVDPATQQPLPPQPVLDPATGQPQTQLRSDVFLAFQWPIPFWADDSWPMEMLWYRWIPDEVWPMPIVKPGIGELRFINWVMSFLAVKVKRACQTTVGVVKAASEDLKKQLLSGLDYNIIELESSVGMKLDEIVSFLQAPDFHPAIWTMLSQVFDLFDKRVGLTELIYGVTSNQLRTAEEANVKQQNLSIRPDDMANLTEDFMSKVARKEAMAMRWLLEGKDVQPYLGQIAAQVWDMQVVSTDLDTVCKEFRYRIEAGTMRKPNKGREIADANQAIQVFSPVMQWYMQATGNTAPFDALIQKWAKANEVEMPTLPPIQMGPPPGAQPTQPGQPQQNQQPSPPQNKAA